MNATTQQGGCRRRKCFAPVSSRTAVQRSKVMSCCVQGGATPWGFVWQEDEGTNRGNYLHMLVYTCLYTGSLEAYKCLPLTFAAISAGMTN